MKWYHWWGFQLTGTSGLYLRTPLFLILVSYGDKHYDKQTYWWGFEVCWKRNTPVQEYELLFKKSYKFTFREYAYRRAVMMGGLPI
jgi:hypothetical protein